MSLLVGQVLFQLGHLFLQLIGLGFHTGDLGLRRGLSTALRFICLSQALMSLLQRSLPLLQSCLELSVISLHGLMLSVDTAVLGFQVIDPMLKFRGPLPAFDLRCLHTAL